MSENAQNPAAQNPSKADTSSSDYERAWKAFNYMNYIVNCLPTSTYEQAIQDQIQTIQANCSDLVGFESAGQGQLSGSEGAKLMIAFANQLQKSPIPLVVNLAGDIISRSNDIASLS